MLRLAIGLILALLPACFFNGNGQIQADAKDNGNGNASNNGNNNGNNNGTGPVVGGVDAPGDGAWDITTASGGGIGPSEFVLAGARATGFVATRSEGQPDPGMSWCTITKDRTEFQLDAESDVLSGTFTVLTYWSGASCPAAQSRVTKVTGRRSSPGKNDLDGTWSISVTDSGRTDTGTLSVSASAGSVSATSPSPELAFAARRR